MEQYKEIFINESEEHLQAMSAAILDLERAPADMEIVNKIFRSAHTIKGMSATMGYDKLAKLTHHMEDVLDSFRKGEAVINSSVVDVLLRCLDALEGLLEEVKTGKVKKIDVEELIQQLNSFLPVMAKVKKVTQQADIIKTNIDSPEENVFNDIEQNILLTAEKDGFNLFRVKVIFVPSCELKSVRAFMVCRNIEKLADIIKSIPSTQELEEGNFGEFFTLSLITRNTSAKIKSIIMSIAEIEKIEIEKIKLSTIKSSVSTKNNKTAAKDVDTGVVRKIQSIRVNTDRLDKLMNLVGELVISKIRLLQISRVHRISDLDEILMSIDRLTQELQDIVLQARLVPISHVFDRFPRMVRDLAKGESKQVDLKISGGEIELDRTVLDEIGDPLVHLLRNAVDHGIELPDIRSANNKKSRGTIKLSARRERTHVFVEVSDDGQGIEVKKIRELVIKKGFMSQEAAAKINQSDLLGILTTPGFSAAEVVTDTSGRGVGMDVVKNKIESLGGSLEFETMPGQGSQFLLKLPMTVAIIQAMLIKLSTETYAIPLSSIRETIKIEQDKIKRIEHYEVIQLRGEVLPLLRLREVFGMKRTNAQDDKKVAVLEKEELSIVVVEMGGKKAGLVVDSLIGQQEVVIKSVGSLLKGIKGFAGATILGDGTVALIVDVATLI